MAKLVALVWDESKAFFFNGAEYARYDIAADQADEGYPQAISSGWAGVFESDLDAAVVWPNGKAYFFKGDEYTRYNIAADQADEGYPQAISSGWAGVFESDLDAAVVWPNGKAYFFKGDQYIRYDIAADQADEGYPQAISPGWAGVFESDLDAAVVWPNGKAYFFKGGEYVRYDIEADQADGGYPKAISAWGLPFDGGKPVQPASFADDFRNRCAQLLAKHEGRRKHVYLDTLNIPSIGIGFNLQRGGARQALASVGADYDQVLAGAQDLTDAQVDALFNRDLDTALAASQRQVPNFADLHPNAQLVVVDMMFMGEAAFARFKKMIAALENLDYNTAADEMVNSKWYVQVKNRGVEDVSLMRAAAG
jgi:GH24 family phage-related lysozyme (muramidase)